MTLPWYTPSSSKNIKPYPWLGAAAVEHLEKIIQPEFEVIEHGSGGSTLWLAERVKSVTAYENDPDWQMVVKQKAPANVRVISQGTHKGVTRPNELGYDLLLIDGEPVQERTHWILSAPNLVKSGGWVVLDNANRPEYAAERAWLQAQSASFETVDCNEGNTKYLVTEFYRMKP